MSHAMAKENPQRPLLLYQPSNDTQLQPAINFSIMNGVRSSSTLQKTDDLKKALAERNAEASPHLSFVDMGGHGYSLVRVTSADIEVEFVCIPRPLERNEKADGGPLAYIVAHRVKHWNPGDTPRLERTKLEGKIPLM